MTPAAPTPRACSLVGAPRAAILALAAALALLGGCRSDSSAPPPAEPSAVQRGEPPAYADLARRHNERAALLGSIRASAVVSLRHRDKDGAFRTDSADTGVLQFVAPDRVALRLDKVGRAIFWLGSDDARYWWFDLSGDPRTAVVGAHAAYGPAQAARLGLPLHPLDLARLLGTLPWPPAGGRTEWSKDGALVGVTTPIARGGLQRVWVDPATLLPQSVELFGPRPPNPDPSKPAAPRPFVGKSELADYRGVELRNLPAWPLAPGRVRLLPAGTDAELRLVLADMTDGQGERRISPQAFAFDALAKSFSIERVVDLDAPPPDAAPALGARP